MQSRTESLPKLTIFISELADLLDKLTDSGVELDLHLVEVRTCRVQVLLRFEVSLFVVLEILFQKGLHLRIALACILQSLVGMQVQQGITYLVFVLRLEVSRSSFMFNLFGFDLAFEVLDLSPVIECLLFQSVYNSVLFFKFQFVWVFQLIQYLQPHSIRIKQRHNLALEFCVLIILDL